MLRFTDGSKLTAKKDSPSQSICSGGEHQSQLGTGHTCDYISNESIRHYVSCRTEAVVDSMEQGSIYLF